MYKKPFIELGGQEPVRVSFQPFYLTRIKFISIESQIRTRQGIKDLIIGRKQDATTENTYNCRVRHILQLRSFFHSKCTALA